MAHPLDRPIASDLSYQVLQRNRRQAQLTTPQTHERLGVSYLLCQQSPVVRFWDDGDPVNDERELERS